MTLLLLFVVYAAPLHGQSRLWRAEDRVLISDFSEVLALASDFDVLYGVTPNGLLVYDMATRAFRAPITGEDGYPVWERPLSAVYARSDFALLVGTAQGGIYSMRTMSPRFDDVARVPGAVLGLHVPEATMDSYAETSAGWFMLRSGSFMAQPVARPRLEPQPGADDPYLRSMLGTAGLVPGRGAAPVSALAEGREPGTYFAGTLGHGLVALDTRTLESTRLPYGLTTRGVNAVAIWRDRVWFGGDAYGTAGEGPLVSATSDLATFVEHAPTSGAPHAAVTALLATDSALWVGSEQGLRALSQSGEWHDYTRAVPDHVTSLARIAGGIFVGTELGAYVLRGMTAGRAAGRIAEPVLTGAAVYGMAAGTDTLWMASNAGLAALPLRGETISTVLLRGGGSPIGRVVDVLQQGDTLYAVAEDGLYRRGPAGWLPPDRTPALRLGWLRHIRAADGVLWLTGTAGFAVAGAPGGDWTYLTAPEDVQEGPVRDLLPAGEHVWLATPAGALRIRNTR